MSPDAHIAAPDIILNIFYIYHAALCGSTQLLEYLGAPLSKGNHTNVIHDHEWVIKRV